MPQHLDAATAEAGSPDEEAAESDEQDARQIVSTALATIVAEIQCKDGDALFPLANFQQLYRFSYMAEDEKVRRRGCGPCFGWLLPAPTRARSTA